MRKLSRVKGPGPGTTPRTTGRLASENHETTGHAPKQQKQQQLEQQAGLRSFAPVRLISTLFEKEDRW